MNASSPHLQQGLRLKKARKLLKIKQLELANMTGISLAAIKAYERGGSSPKKMYAQKLEEVARINMQYVLKGIGEPLLPAAEQKNNTFEIRKAERELNTGSLRRIDKILEDIQFLNASTALRLLMAELLDFGKISETIATKILACAKNEYEFHSQELEMAKASRTSQTDRKILQHALEQLAQTENELEQLIAALAQATNAKRA